MVAHNIKSMYGLSSLYLTFTLGTYLPSILQKKIFLKNQIEEGTYYLNKYTTYSPLAI